MGSLFQKQNETKTLQGGQSFKSPLASLMQSVGNKSGSESPTLKLGGNSNLLSKFRAALIKKYNAKLSLNDIKTPILKAIFKKENQEIREQIKLIAYQCKEQNQFEQEMTFAFWLSIHLELLDQCNYLIKKVPLLKKIVASTLKKQKENKSPPNINKAFSQFQQLKSIKPENKDQKMEIKELNSDYDENDQKDQNFGGIKIQTKSLKDEEPTMGPVSPQKFSIFNQISVIKNQPKNVEEESESSDDEGSDGLIPPEFKVNTENAEELFQSFEQALKLRAFDKLIFREDTVVNKLLTFLNDGARTNYCLDIIGLIDISIWKNRQLKEMLNIFSGFSENNYEQNKLLLSCNPIQTVVLSCEVLKFIQNFRKKFENECKRLSNQLLNLGEMIISKIHDLDYYERLMLDLDSKERTVLKIVTLNNFEKLMDENDPKAENLMNKIWKGKEANNCGGMIFGYSALTNVVFKSYKKLKGRSQNYGIYEIAKNGFLPNYKVDYIFQHRYRSRAISFYFLKEFFCALIMLIIFQWINYQYLTMGEIVSESSSTDVTSTTFQNLQEDMNQLQSQDSTINSLSKIAFLFAFALLFQLILKIMFNIFSKNKIPFDKWTIIDSISAILNIAAVQVIKSVTLEDLQNPTTKDTLDYFMIFVLTLSWIRFFMYFLVVRSISKLLLTLIEMVEDTISFIFIVACFIIIMSSIFTTLYQDINPDRFGSLTQTVRTLFDAMLTVYSYDDMGGRSLSYSILLVFYVFFGNVLLLNYLVAILTTTYDNMKQSGIFKYKKNLFYYSERFVIAFNEESYGEIVLHPPPLSYLCIFLLPFIRNKEKMKRYSHYLSLQMFWTENIFLVLVFLLYEILLLPFAYIKTVLSIFSVTEAGFIKKICIIIWWLMIGLFVDLYLIIQDLSCFVSILSKINGSEDAIGSYIQCQEDYLDLEIQVQIYNVARDGIICLFKALKSHFNGEQDIPNRKRSQKNVKSSSKSITSLGKSQRRLSMTKQQSLLKQESLKKKISITKSQIQASNDISDTEETSDIEDFNIDDELEKMQLNSGYNPNDANCLYVVKKSLLIQDWLVRRKNQLEYEMVQKQQNEENIEESKSQSQNNSSFQQRKSTRRSQVQIKKQKTLAKINKDNDQQDSLDKELDDLDDDQDELQKGMENKLYQKLLTRKNTKFVFLDHLLNTQHHIKEDSPEKQNPNNFQKGVPEKEIEVNQLELKYIEQFFNNFVIVSETSLSEHLDIVLFLKALPQRITLETLPKVKLFNFKICQESLIAYQNLDLVNAFEYFDDKNRERVQQVKEKLGDQKNSLVEIRDIVRFINKRMQKSERNQQKEEIKIKSDTTPEKSQKSAIYRSIKTVSSVSNNITPHSPSSRTTQNILPRMLFNSRPQFQHNLTVKEEQKVNNMEMSIIESSNQYEFSDE